MTAASRFLRTLAMPLALFGAMVFGSIWQAACSMHGVGVQSRDSTSTSLAKVDSAPAPDGHAHLPHGHDAPQEDDDESSACHCTCLGDCTAGQVATLPSETTLRIAAVVAKPRGLLDEWRSVPLRPTAPHFLPFANGPPDAPLS